MFYEDQGKLEDAIREYAEVVRLTPKETIAHAKLAIALEKHGDRAKAIEHFAEAVSLNPKYADAHYRLGLLLADAGRLEEACEHFRAALALATANGKTELAKEIERKLALCKQKTAYRRVDPTLKC
jgi:tetratricopeptide (TPR) repeat protein